MQSFPLLCSSICRCISGPSNFVLSESIPQRSGGICSSGTATSWAAAETSAAVTALIFALPKTDWFCGPDTWWAGGSCGKSSSDTDASSSSCSSSSCSTLHLTCPHAHLPKDVSYPWMWGRGCGGFTITLKLILRDAQELTHFFDLPCRQSDFGAVTLTLVLSMRHSDFGALHHGGDG
ncbi:hypothetical protein FPQ18DRAFT_156851 [Pyronema domesticum]|nr:hypothetical protein FPQ18DRAFT_156851 [Pyronema domesticum]